VWGLQSCVCVKLCPRVCSETRFVGVRLLSLHSGTTVAPPWAKQVGKTPWAHAWRFPLQVMTPTGSHCSTQCGSTRLSYEIYVCLRRRTHTCLCYFFSWSYSLHDFSSPAMDTDTTLPVVVVVVVVCPTAATARANFQRTWPRCMRIEDLWQYAYGATGVPPHCLRRGTAG
jgi:hypothetical protein